MGLENAEEFFSVFLSKKKKRTKLFFFFFLTWGLYTCVMLVFRAAKKLLQWKNASYVNPEELFTENQSC